MRFQHINLLLCESEAVYVIHSLYMQNNTVVHRGVTQTEHRNYFSGTNAKVNSTISTHQYIQNRYFYTY